MSVSRYFFLISISVLVLAGCHSVYDTSQKSEKTQMFVKTEPQRYQIMGKGAVSENTLLNYLMRVNKRISPRKAAYVVRTYIWECAYEGVNHDVAFVQMCHETNFLRFGGDVSATQNNFCGLGATGNSYIGYCFPDMKTGIRAHVQHLKAYGSTKPLVNRCVDPRFALVIRGSARNVSELTGKWAMDGNYGRSLRKKIDMLINFENESRK